MVVNLIFFSVKIERIPSSIAARIARREQERKLIARREAHMLEAASYPDYAARL